MFKHCLYGTALLFTVLSFAACTTDAPNVATTGTSGETTITIIHNNDFHSQLESLYPEGEPSQGSAARLQALVKKIRAEKGAENTLLLFGGDMFQGSLYYNTWLGSAEIMVMNHMGYDAVALGNHEFDSGTPELARALRGEPVEIAGKSYPTEKAKFIALGSNIDYSNEPLLQDLLVKRAIVEKNGEKYGLIGVTTTSTETGSSPGPNVHFGDYVPYIQQQADALTAEGINKIIVMSHIGYDVDIENVPQLSHVDVIVAGHDHALLGDPATVEALGIPKQIPRIKGPYPTVLKDKDGNDTVVVTAMEKGRWLGEIDVTFDKKGRVIADKLKPNLTFVRGCDVLADKTEDCTKEVITPDAEMAALVKQYGEPLEAFANVVMGEAAVTFGGRSSETTGAPAMGDLIADILLDRAKVTNRADAAFVNRGGIRTDLVKGTVRYKDINAVMPFNNTLALLDLTGDELVTALDHGLTQGYGQSPGAKPHVSGMTVHHCAAAPCPKAIHQPNGVVTAITIDGKPLNLKTTYRIATIDYIMGGGDLYTMLKEACAREGNYCRKSSVMVRDIISDWFKNHSPVSPLPATRLVVQQ